MREEFSAGGVVVKDGQVAVIVPKDTNVLALPKGLRESGETELQTALREVREETGIVAQSVDDQPLDTIQYWFTRHGERTRKKVTFFLLLHIEGDISKHDHEIDQVLWIPLSDAEKRLTYPTERKLITIAKARLNSES